MTPLHPTTLIAVPVPLESENFDVEIVNTNKWLQYSMPYGKSSEIILEDCNFKILGTVTKDTIDFDPSVIGMTEAQVRSLLSANGLFFENPYGEEPNHAGFNLTGHPAMDASIKKNIMWQTSQSKVNSKYVILKKI